MHRSLHLAFPLVIACSGGGDDTATLARDDTGETSDVPDPLSWDIEEPGPYGVGFRSWDHTYSPGEGFEDRTIRINLWYPTLEEDGDPATYTVGVDPLSFEDAELAPPTHAATAVPAWSGEAGFPVHVHSHGSQGYGATSAFLSRHFASHGWVFIAPDHTDNTLVDNVDPRPSEHYLHRPLDISQALDQLQQLPAEDPLHGLAHTDRVLLSGHSFGVYTTWANAGATYDLEQVQAACDAGELGGGTCHPELLTALAAGVADARVVAALPMAGTYRDSWFGDTGFQSVSIPVLSMTGTNDEVGQQEQWELIEGIDFTWMDIEGGCHQTFALGTCDTLDTDEGYRIVRTYALALGRSAVLGDDTVDDVLSGEVEVAPEVSLQRK